MTIPAPHDPHSPTGKYPPSSSTISHCLFSWVIPEIERERLDRYYLLRWEVEYFSSQHSQFSCISHQGIEYNTVYLEGCTPASLGNYKNMLLSFRRVTGWERGHVLVRPEYGSEL
jgi:hypothetical protein